MKPGFLPLVLLLTTLPLSVIAQTPRYARVISENANLRDTPSVSSTSTQEVAEATLVKVLDEKLPWYVVRVGNRVGWMHGETIEFLNTETPTPSRLNEQSVSPSYTPSTSPPPRRVISAETPSDSGGYIPRAPVSGRTYITGPRGGCYYISSSHRKVYVDRSLCN